MREIKKVYGPYLKNNQNRRMVVVQFMDGTKKSMAYARHLMEVHLGRELSKDEEVDHIDRNKLNDCIENLQILKVSDHRQKDKIKTKLINIPCIWCSKVIEVNPATLNRNNAWKDRAGPFCSKSCVGKYGVELQNGRIDKISFQRFEVERYY